MTPDVFEIVGSDRPGGFHVERVVAQGGFGVVYRAIHPTFRVPVALKCLKIPQELSAAQKGDLLERFREEGALLFRLSATFPVVVRPLHIDAFTSEAGDFVPFLVLEWLEGETLDVVAVRRSHRGRPFTLKRLMRLLQPVSLALEEGHHLPGPARAECIVHCDLKPENIFVTGTQGEQTARILDFGIGQVLSLVEGGAARARGGEWSRCSFSPPYGAPEQWAPERFGSVGPWTDVWGLALTMVEVLAQHRAIDGDVTRMRNVALDPRRRPTPRREGIVVNDEAETVFEKALAVDPRTRYRSIARFWEDLTQAVGDLSRRSSPPSGAAPDALP